jgi:hypothetical protein
MIQFIVDLLPFLGILGTLYLINNNTRAIGVIIEMLRLLDERFSAEDIVELRRMAQASRTRREAKEAARKEVAKTLGKPL